MGAALRNNMNSQEFWEAGLWYQKDVVPLVAGEDVVRLFE